MPLAAVSVTGCCERACSQQQVCAGGRYASLASGHWRGCAWQCREHEVEGSWYADTREWQHPGATTGSTCILAQRRRRQLVQAGMLENSAVHIRCCVAYYWAIHWGPLR
jgi:hypothetical protein